MEAYNGLDLSHAAPNIISIILSSMPLRDRFICALVCKAWAEAATAATHTIILEDRTQDLSSLQTWLEKHGHRLEVLQLQACYNAALTALPCWAKLKKLLLQGSMYHDPVSIASRTWGGIASATKLTSVSLERVQTASQQADVVAALTALPNLEQLTWDSVHCSGEEPLSDSSLLQGMTRLTSLVLHGLTAAALQHLGSLTKLQHLSIRAEDDWPAAGCPGLQELKALTSLKLLCGKDLPASAGQMTALQQLTMWDATPTGLNALQALSGLTHLRVYSLQGLSSGSGPLQLPGLQHLELLWSGLYDGAMPMSFLASCTKLQYLKLYRYRLEGSLVPTTMLQQLELVSCKITATDGAEAPASWERVFPGAGGLPNLTSLHFSLERPALQYADINSIVACCSSLKGLGLDTLQDSFVPELARLPGLTNLRLLHIRYELCTAMVQLTGLRQLVVAAFAGCLWVDPRVASAVGLRQLAALKQLTSLELGPFSCSQLNSLAKHLMKDDLPGCLYSIINKVCDCPFTTATVFVSRL